MVRNFEPPIFVSEDEVVLHIESRGSFYELAAHYDGPVRRIPNHFQLSKRTYWTQDNEMGGVVARSDKSIEDDYSYLDLSPSALRKADESGKAKIHAARAAIETKKTAALEAKRDWCMRQYSPDSPDRIYDWN